MTEEEVENARGKRRLGLAERGREKGARETLAGLPDARRGPDPRLAAHRRVAGVGALRRATRLATAYRSPATVTPPPPLANGSGLRVSFALVQG